VWEKILAFLAARGIGVTFSIPLPSFYRVPEEESVPDTPSQTTDMGPEDVPHEGTSRDFRHAEEELVRRFIFVKRDFEADYPGLKLEVSCTHRSVGEQQRLFRKGRFGNPGPRVTNCDGKERKSDHNYYPSRALDTFITDGGKAIWDEKVYYPLGMYCKRHGLLWGGSGASFQDYPHIYLPKDLIKGAKA